MKTDLLNELRKGRELSRRGQMKIPSLLVVQ